jgi:hypothetical protein
MFFPGRNPAFDADDSVHALSLNGNWNGTKSRDGADGLGPPCLEGQMTVRVPALPATGRNQQIERMMT